MQRPDYTSDMRSFLKTNKDVDESVSGAESDKNRLSHLCLLLLQSDAKNMQVKKNHCVHVSGVEVKVSVVSKKLFYTGSR